MMRGGGRRGERGRGRGRGEENDPSHSLSLSFSLQLTRQGQHPGGRADGGRHEGKAAARFFGCLLSGRRPLAGRGRLALEHLLGVDLARMTLASAEGAARRRAAAARKATWRGAVVGSGREGGREGGGEGGGLKNGEGVRWMREESEWLPRARAACVSAPPRVTPIPAQARRKGQPFGRERGIGAQGPWHRGRSQGERGVHRLRCTRLATAAPPRPPRRPAALFFSLISHASGERLRYLTERLVRQWTGPLRHRPRATTRKKKTFFLWRKARRGLRVRVARPCSFSSLPSIYRLTSLARCGRAGQGGTHGEGGHCAVGACGR